MPSHELASFFDNHDERRIRAAHCNDPMAGLVTKTEPHAIPRPRCLSLWRCP